MISSRALHDLLPEVEGIARTWLDACTAHGVDVLVYCTYRDFEMQDALYEKGRSGPGPIVTNARGGYSWHNFRRAWDAVPMLGGKPDWSYSWNDTNWQVMVQEARKLGIEWAGDWKSFKEYVHFQVTGGLTLAQARGEV